MRRRLIVGALGLLLLAGCTNDADESAEETSTTTTVVASPTESSTTTTTIAPEDIEPVDDEGFDIDREVDPDAEAESLGPIGATETTIATDEGEFSVGGGDVPDLAEAFPLPDGFEVQLTTEIPGEIGFSGRVDGVLADLVAFYEVELPEAGYEITERQEVDGVLAALSIAGPLDGDVVISEEPGTDDGWTILVALVDPNAG